jgi:hypothetical protein
VWRRGTRTKVEKKRCCHYFREKNFGERAEVIKEDFEKKPSVKYVLPSNAFGVEIFLLSVLLLKDALRWTRERIGVGLAEQPYEVQ